jgi:hypothetical protein
VKLVPTLRLRRRNRIVQVAIAGLVIVYNIIFMIANAGVLR